MRSQRDANLFAAAMASRRCVCCKAHLYLQIRYVRQRGVLCRGATVYAASKAQPNIRGSQRDANLFAAAMASRRCVCCKAHLYLQIECGQATWSALPRRNSICGKQSAAEYTQRFKHLNRDRIRKIHCNLLKNFPLQGFNKHPHWFRCSGKGEHLNLAARQNPAAKPLTTNVLQDFRQLCQRFRSQHGLECRGIQMRQEVFLARVSTKHATEQPMHLNRNKTRKIHCNLLRYFLLRDFSKHLHRFRCSGKGKHLNLAARQNPAAKPLTTNVLQDFRQLYPWFRSQVVLEHRRMQMRTGSTSGKGLHQTRNRTAHASEPEQNTKNSLQLIEILSVARF